MTNVFLTWLMEDIGCSQEGARRYAEKNPHMFKCWRAATLAERERCAKEADQWTGCDLLAAEIRKGDDA